MASKDPSDLVGQPALAEPSDGGEPIAGEVAHVREEPDGSKRAQLRTDGGEAFNTALDRVESVADAVDDLVRIVGREVRGPDHPHDRATMVCYGDVVAGAHAETDVGRDELDHVLRAAVCSGALVEWTTSEGRWFVPAEEGALRNVIVEENMRSEPSGGLLEACKDALNNSVGWSWSKEVDDDE